MRGAGTADLRLCSRPATAIASRNTAPPTTGVSVRARSTCSRPAARSRHSAVRRSRSRRPGPGRGPRACRRRWRTAATRRAPRRTPFRRSARRSRSVCIGSSWTSGSPVSDVPVLMHDPTVGRTTNGTGAVTSLSLAQVRALDAGSWFSREYRGTKVPTLYEVLKLAESNDASVLVELKTTPTPAQMTQLLDRIRWSSMASGVTRHQLHRGGHHRRPGGRAGPPDRDHRLAPLPVAGVRAAVRPHLPRQRRVADGRAFSEVARGRHLSTPVDGRHRGGLAADGLRQGGRDPDQPTGELPGLGTAALQVTRRQLPGVPASGVTVFGSAPPYLRSRCA